jgi:D-arabinitol dehydrogenase (NADP+)
VHIWSGAPYEQNLVSLGICTCQSTSNVVRRISPYEIFYKELQIRGVNINPFTFTKALGMIEALGNRYLNYNMLGIKTFPLNQYQEAIDMLKKGAISKAIFKM